jgi:hypothetical protein
MENKKKNRSYDFLSKESSEILTEEEIEMIIKLLEKEIEH